MIPIIAGFAEPLDEGQGLARDMRVRWALEEVGQRYETRLLTLAEMKEPAHRARHPFGQIPTYEEGSLVLFESGAIVHHVAERHRGLLPEGPARRARAVSWMFSALNSVEPPIFDRDVAMVLETEEPWHRARMVIVEARIRERLGDLAAALGDSDWLVGEFSAADLLMIAVLRMLSGTEIVAAFPSLVAYVARGEARPAFRRAFDAQAAVYAAHAKK